MKREKDIVKYYKKRCFSYNEFDLIKLYEIKKRKGISLAVVIPTFNNEKTIGLILETIQNNLMTSKYSFVNELVVIDSDSNDSTKKEVEKRGVKFIKSSNFLPNFNSIKGKGENLWKSLLATKADIIVWVDADSLNPHPGYVYGLAAPLIIDKEILFSKAYFLRCTKTSEEKKPEKPNGGRVTEILVRPVLNLLFPELSSFYQPLNGNIAGRRKIFESIEFPTGYGVDISLLIDIAMKYDVENMAQVYCGSFKQKGQDLQGLGRMAFQILRTVLHKAQLYGRLTLHRELPTILNQLKIRKKGEDFKLEKVNLEEKIRPPIKSLNKYLNFQYGSLQKNNTPPMPNISSDTASVSSRAI